MSYYHYIKALHLIFVITWFAGLFYTPRLFIYQIEATNIPSPEKEILISQFKIMTKRLWTIIAWPSALLATVFALWLLILNPNILSQPWMHIKLTFVVLLLVYHIKTHQFYKRLQSDKKVPSSNFMRLWNEGATFMLFAIIFIVILKSAFNWIFGVLGTIILGGLIAFGYKFYKRIREKHQ